MPDNKKQSSGPVEIAIGTAVMGGMSGAAGGWALSFFRPELAIMGPGLGTAAGVGAIAFSVAFLPRILTNYLMRDSEYFAQHPCLEATIKNTVTVLSATGAFIGSVFVLGAPLTASVACCMIVIPLIWYALGLLILAAEAKNSPNADQQEPPTYGV